MKATVTLIYFPKQSKRETPPKPPDKEKPKPKGTVLDWIRNGFQFISKGTSQKENAATARSLWRITR